MTNSLDERLTAARSTDQDEPAVAAALASLAEGRANRARRRSRSRAVVPSLVLGTVLAVGGAGAVAAQQWGPWEMSDPDLVVSREWAAVDGTPLGSCETRISAAALPADAYATARSYLDSIDVDAVEPNPEVVAGALHAVGRPDDVGQLVAGASADDFETHGHWHPSAREWFSDARILQDALTHEIFAGMARDVLSQNPDVEHAAITAAMETQCTTDPNHAGDQ